MKNFDYFKDTLNNVYQIRIDGDVFCVDIDNLEQSKILEEILSMLQNNEDVFCIQEKLFKKFPKPTVTDTLNSLLDAIPSLIPTHKLSKDISKIVIISNGFIGHQIKQNIQLRNDELKLFDYSEIDGDTLDDIISSMDFAFVDATSWAPYFIRLINQKAIKWNKPWLLIGGQLSKHISIGPLFYGKDTACYECLITRVKTNLEYRNLYSAYYDNLCNSHVVSSVKTKDECDNTLLSLLADFAVIEYMNFVNGWNTPQTYRTVIEFNKNDFSLKKHTLLKVPYCTICNPKIEYDVNPWLDEICIK